MISQFISHCLINDLALLLVSTTLFSTTNIDNVNKIYYIRQFIFTLIHKRLKASFDTCRYISLQVLKNLESTLWRSFFKTKQSVYPSITQVALTIYHPLIRSFYFWMPKNSLNDKSMRTLD